MTRFDEIDAIREKIGLFQRQIVELNGLIQKTSDAHNNTLRNHYLEIVGWVDLLSGILLDLADPSHTQNPQVSKSLERLAKRIDRFLARNSVVPVVATSVIEYQGDGIKVVDTIRNQALQDGAVVEVIRRGYLWDGKVLRPHEVVTVKNECLIVK